MVPEKAGVTSPLNSRWLSNPKTISLLFLCWKDYIAYMLIKLEISGSPLQEISLGLILELVLHFSHVLLLGQVCP